MARIISSIITAIYLLLIGTGGFYSIEKASEWVQKKALEKAQTDLGSMEKMSQTLTGGRVDF